MQTPWGEAQNIETISRGLEFVDTAGHGGIKVSDQLNKNIPIWIKEETHNRLGIEGWYEEDCDWCIPVIIFSIVFYGWAKKEGSEAYIASAHERFKDLFLPDLRKKKIWAAELISFCEKYGIDCQDLPL
jgi:hypothetical protein